MLRLERVTEQTPELERIKSLYESAFPKNERKPLALFLREAECCDFVAFYDEGRYCGFAILLTWKDITHILYFAVENELRGRGYGASALHLLQTLRPGNRYIADIEVDHIHAPNHEQRQKRKRFYLRNGYQESGVTYEWQDENYEIMVSGGTVTLQEDDDFWEYFEPVYGD